MCKRIVLIALLAPLLAVGPQAAADEGRAEPEARYFDGRQWRPLWQSDAEVAEIVPRVAAGRSLAAPPAGARLAHEGRLRIWSLAGEGGAAVTPRSLVRAEPGRYSPVFHLSPGGGLRLVPDGKVVVRFHESPASDAVAAWAAARGLGLVSRLSLPGTYLLDAGAGTAALEQANAIQESGAVRYAVPQWWRETLRR